jgi:pyruvate, orthophosphate dikinase
MNPSQAGYIRTSKNFSPDASRARLADTAIPASDWITIDGYSGNIYLGRCETAIERPEAELAAIAAWRSQGLHRDHGGHKPKSASRRATG